MGCRWSLQTRATPASSGAHFPTSSSSSPIPTHTRRQVNIDTSGQAKHSQRSQAPGIPKPRYSFQKQPKGLLTSNSTPKKKQPVSSTLNPQLKNKNTKQKKQKHETEDAKNRPKKKKRIHGPLAQVLPYFSCSISSTTASSASSSCASKEASCGSFRSRICRGGARGSPGGKTEQSRMELAFAGSVHRLYTRNSDRLYTRDRIVCTRGTGSSLHAGLFCPGSFVHAVLTAMHKKGQGR